MRCSFCNTEQSEGDICRICGWPLGVQQTQAPETRNNDPWGFHPGEQDRPVVMEMPPIVPYPGSPVNGGNGGNNAPAVKKSKAPVIAAAAAGAALLTGGLIFLLSGSSGGIKTAEPGEADEVAGDNLSLTSAASSEGQEITTGFAGLTVPSATTTAPVTAGTETEASHTAAGSAAAAGTTAQTYAPREETSSYSVRPTETSKPEEITPPAVQDYSWITPYISTAKQFERERTSFGSEIQYFLLYITGDGIPELYARETGSGRGKLFTFADGKVCLLHSTEPAGSDFLAAYSAQKGKFYTLSGNMSDSLDLNYTFFTVGDNGTAQTEHTARRTNQSCTVDGQSVDPGDFSKITVQYTSITEKDKMSLQTLLEKLKSFGPDYKEENVEPPAAVALADMTVSQILDIAADDYRAVKDSSTGFVGIASDKYFPDTEIYFDGMFESVEAAVRADADIAQIKVYSGGLIGDRAKVGNTYHDMITMIDSLGGIDVSDNSQNSGRAFSYVDGRGVYLYFDHIEELKPLAARAGCDLADGFKTSAKCTMAVIYSYTAEEPQLPVTVNTNALGIRVAPYSDATVLLSAMEGDTLCISDYEPIYSDGTYWYRVTAYYYNGVRKHGYVRAEYVE